MDPEVTVGPLIRDQPRCDQAVTKGLSSSSKFSGSCVPTLQTLPQALNLRIHGPVPLVRAQMRYEVETEGPDHDSRSTSPWVLGGEGQWEWKINKKFMHSPFYIIDLFLFGLLTYRLKKWWMHKILYYFTYIS